LVLLIPVNVLNVHLSRPSHVLNTPFLTFIFVSKVANVLSFCPKIITSVNRLPDSLIRSYILSPTSLDAFNTSIRLEDSLYHTAHPFLITISPYFFFIQKWRDPTLTTISPLFLNSLPTAYVIWDRSVLISKVLTPTNSDSCC